MLATVFRMRENGARREDERSGAGVTGQLLLMWSVGTPKTAPFRSLTLSSSDGMAKQLLPPLFEPQLLTLGANGMMFRGFERRVSPIESYSVLQEWHVLFVSPEELSARASAGER